MYYICAVYLTWPIYRYIMLYLSEEYPYQMWMAEVQDDCLLGLDFPEHHNCLMNQKYHCLRIGSQEIPFSPKERHH